MEPEKSRAGLTLSPTSTRQATGMGVIQIQQILETIALLRGLIALGTELMSQEQSRH
jgi:hypothetical protein